MPYDQCPSAGRHAYFSKGVRLSGKGRLPGFSGAAGRERENSGVRIIGVGQPSGGRLTRMTSFARKVYEAALAVDADLYHLHDPELLPYGIKLKRRGKGDFRQSRALCRAAAAKPYLPGWCTRIIAFGYARYERYVLRRLDGAIFPCTVNGEDPFAGRCPHTALVDNSVKLEDFYERYDPEAVRNQDQICLTGSLTEAGASPVRSGLRRRQSVHLRWLARSLRRTMRPSSGRCRNFPA